MSADSGNLDYLRATAVLCVITNHIFYTLGSPEWYGRTLINPAALGRVGVLLFFVHTSLVLMLSLERSWAKSRRPILAFYIRRAFRIYPLLVVCSGLAFLLAFPPSPWDPKIHGSFVVFAANFLLIQNITHSPSILGAAWSLPYEVQMYVALPVLFLILRKTTRPLWAIAALIAAPAGLFIWLAPTYRIARLLEFVPCFIGGILAFVMLRYVRPKLPAFAWVAGLPMGALGAGVVLSQTWSPEREWILCLALGMVVPLFSELRDGVLRRCAQWVAKYSYGIYLAHLPAIWVAFRILPWSPAARWLGLAGMLLVFPMCLYDFIEEPMIRCGKWLAPGRP